MVSTVYRSAMQWVSTLDKQDWLIVLCLVVVIGIVCLKGFGSRAQY